MAFQNSDLLAINRGGVNYQVTWGDIVSRQVLATDLLMLQRGGTIYHVPIGNFWDCTSISDELDFYLAERNLTLYAQTYKFPCSIQFSLSDNGQGISTTLQLSASPVNGDPGFITYPDGTQIFLSASSQTITLTQPGVYTVGESFTEFKFTQSDSTIDASLTPASVWNDHMSGIADFGAGLFTNVRNLSGVPTGLQLRSLDKTFEGTSPTTDIGVIDTSVVTSAVGTFLNSDVDSTDNIDIWDTSNVTNMSRMFEGAANYNGDISTWDVSNVTDMSAMFKSASNFNQDLEVWGAFVDNVTNMNAMFSGASQFNGAITTWDTSNVEDMNSIFDGSSSFNQDIGDWDVGSAVSMTSAFRNTNQFNQDLTEWCVRTINSEPTNFATGSALINVNKPVWGTCPAPLNGEILLTSGYLRMAGTIPVQGKITKPDGTTTTIGPGNWSYNTSAPGWYSLPQEDMTTLRFDNSTSAVFDFDPGFYTGNLTNMAKMFANCYLFNGDISNWDTSRVTNMEQMFYEARVFDGDIGDWITASATNARWLFYNATIFNQDISGWNTGNFSNFHQFLRGATKFNQPIGSWNVGSGTDFRRMFLGAEEFNQPLGSWNITGATDFSEMFRNAKAFNQDLSAWDTTNVLAMNQMFMDSGINSPLNFNTSKVENMGQMFRNASNFNQDINSWDVRQVEYMADMFNQAINFNQSLPDWKPTNPRLGNTDMTSMFRGAAAMQGDLSTWCVPQVRTKPTYFNTGAGFEFNAAVQPHWGTCPITDPTGFIINDFNGDNLYVKFGFSSSASQEIIFPDGSVVAVSNNAYTQLTQLGQYEFPMGVVTNMQFYGSTSSSQYAQNVDYTFEPGFYTSGITNMAAMFRNSQGFNGDVSGWDTSGVTCMYLAFDNAKVFNGDISNWDVSRVGTFSTMFNNARAFNSDISQWDTSNAVNMGGMFTNATVFNQELSLWDVSKVQNMARMFQRASAFNQYLNPWDVSEVRNMTNMFNMATSMNGDISNWCVDRFRGAPTRFDNGAAFQGDTSVLPNWGFCTEFNGIYLRELVGGTGDLVIGGVASDNTVQIRQPDGTFTNPGTGSFANKYTQLGWYEIKNMESLTGLRFFDNDILFDDTSETAKFYFSDRFDTSNLNEFRQMFREANVFDGSLSMFDTSNATNMAAMFRNNAAFDGDITHFDTSNVDNMANMFRGASSFTKDISGWTVFNVTDMDDMFREAAAYGSNLSDWCVPQIASTPADFDTNSGFAGNAAIQPQWGTCPLAITFTSPPVIDNLNGTVPAPYTEDVKITTAAVVSAGATVSSYQWQRSADGSTGWADIPAGEGVSTEAERAPNGFDKNQYIRVVVTYSAPTVPDASIESNAILVENGSAPTAPLYTTSKFTDFPLGVEIKNEATSTYFPVQLLGTDGLLYNYAGDANVLGIVNPATSDWVEFRELDYAGAGIVSSTGTEFWQGGTSIPGTNKHILWGRDYLGVAIYDYIADTWETVTFDSPYRKDRDRGIVYSKVTQKYYNVPRFPYYSPTPPSDAPTNFYEIDPVALTATTVLSNQIALPSQPGRGRVYSCACDGPDGKIYYFPNRNSNATSDPLQPFLGQFDPVTRTMVDMVCPMAYSQMWSSFPYITFGTPIYAPESNAIYAPPYNTNNFLKLDFNNMVGGLPTASVVTQTVDPRTESDGSTRGKWSGMVRREDGLYQCLPVGQFARNAALDPTTDAVIDLGPNNLGQTTNSTFSGGVMTPIGRASSSLVMNTQGTGGAINKVEQVPMWETFSGSITIYDPVHPDYNKIFGYN